MSDPKKEKKKFLVVRRIDGREEIHRIEVTGKSENTVEKIEMGMLRNMSDDYFIDEVTE